MRVALLVAVLVGSAIGAVVGFGARPADACLRLGIASAAIPDVVGRSEIVAIGTFIVTSERAGTFRVDEALMGTNEGDLLRIDNRTSYTSFLCSPYDEPFHEGDRFEQGARRVVILEKEVDGLWQVGYSSDTAWDIPENDEQTMTPEYWLGEPPPSLKDVRAEIRKSAKLLGSDLEFESRGPCNGEPGYATRVAASTAVVLADVEPSTEFATARVREVIAGDVDKQTIKLNQRARRSYETCDVVLDPVRQGYPLSGRYLIFLRPDEFGIGDYRIAYWGSAIEQANERYITQGLPTLRDVRNAVAASGRGQAASIDDGDDDGPGMSWLGLALGVLLFAAPVAWRWRR